MENKTALVTGAAIRVGKAIALRLASLGCDMVVHYRNSRDEAEETSEMIRNMGRKALLVQADLSDKEEAVRLAEESVAWQGNLAILVNSAANFPRVDFSEIDRSDWDLALDANLLGPFWLSQSIGAHLVNRGEGKIVNIADTSWRSPWATRFPYSVSKAGLVAMTVGLAKVFAPQVQVNAIGPGPILFPEDYTPEQKKAVIAKTLLKREGHPDDIADAVEFFCRSDYITGHFLPVDGGQSVPRG